MKEKLAKLINVKTIVTFVITAVCRACAVNRLNSDGYDRGDNGHMFAGTQAEEKWLSVTA